MGLDVRYCAGLDHKLADFLTKNRQSFAIATFAFAEPVMAYPRSSRTGARFHICSGEDEAQERVAKVSAGCYGEMQHACLAWGG